MRLHPIPSWLLSVFALATLAGLRAADRPELTPAEAELAKKFAGVTHWQGIFDVSVIGSATRANGGYHLDSRYEGASHGTFLLERVADDEWDPARGVLTWSGRGQVRGGGQSVFSEWDQHGLGEEWSQEFGGAVTFERIAFSLALRGKSRLVTLHAGHEDEAKSPLMRRTGRMVSRQSGGNKSEPINESFKAPLDAWYLGSSPTDAARRWQVVSNGPGVLAFTYEGPTSGRSQKFEVSGAGVIRRSHVVLFPVYEDLEVEVTIANYAQWRPLGSIADPKKPGNALVARAVLKSKTGSSKKLPAVKEFRFALLDTSREPGVCLNWPLGAKDDDFDLRLATAGTGGTLSNRDQKLAVTDAATDDRQRPYAEATIESFDFGGKAELRVICELEDGRELIGLMKDEGGEQDFVRLPKMKGPDWIAESWRREKDVMKLAFGDDREEVKGQEHKGDGFTLYEEYRGFVVDGKHVEGDPLKKDFFVQNLIGADAQRGIDLFESLSGLRVHDRLRRSEMSGQTRLMNGNRRDAPHVVNQHGVWIKTFPSKSELGDNGAMTVMLEKGVVGRPGKVKGIGLLARGNTESVFSQPFNLPASSQTFAYDRAVAHELLHSVGVEHHGSGDYNLIAGYVSPKNPFNTIGRPYYGTGPKEPIDLRDEGGRDIAARDYPDYVKFRQFGEMALGERLLAEGRKFIADRAGQSGHTIKTAEQYVDANIELLVIYCMMNLQGIAGVQHGEGSGDQDCVMRYYFAKFYEAKAGNRAYYMIDPGTEPIGLKLCRDRTGTGVNASARRPQSRYGDAGGGGGSCFAQICPNDAVPPRKTK